MGEGGLVVNPETSSHNALPCAVLYRYRSRRGAKIPERRACKDRVTLRFLNRHGSERRQRKGVCNDIALLTTASQARQRSTALALLDSSS